jgi:histidinol dehydrogenase
MITELRRMKILRFREPGFQQALTALKRHAEPTQEVQSTVAEIIAAVRQRGDAAVLEYSAKFGAPALKAVELAVNEIPQVEPVTRRALAAADKNVFNFAKKSLRKSWKTRNDAGGNRR